MTRASRATATWTAIDPTPPAAACTSTVSPVLTAVAVSACIAVTPASISPPAAFQLIATGLGTTADAATDSHDHACGLEAEAHRQRGIGPHRAAVALPVHRVDSS